MKLLKKILLVILVIIVAGVLIGFLLPRHVHIERSLVMKAHKGLIFDQISNLKTWTSWSDWHQMDTAMKITYSGPPSGVGAVSEWESDMREVGKGKMRITRASGFDTLSFELSMGDDGTANSHFYLQPVDGGTQVTWTLEADMGRNPVSRYFGLFLDGMVGKNYSRGLENLRKRLELNPNAMLEIVQGTSAATPYLAIRETVTMEQIPIKMPEWYGALMTFTAEKNLEPAGPPFCIYHTWENNSFDMETAFPVMKPVPGEGNIMAGVLPEVKTLSIDFYGPYESSYIPHMVLEEYITANDLKRAGSPREIYITDPAAEPDPQKWLTKIVWPVE